VLIIPSSWGSQLDGEKPPTPRRIKTFFWHRCRGIEEEEAPTSTTFSHVNYAPARFFWRHCRGKRRLLQGEFRTHILYFVLVLLYFIFACIVFIKNTKKNSSYCSCYFCWSVIVLLYHAFYQWLVSLKLNLFGKVGSRKSSKLL
jgi:hypothetical protein